MISRSKGIAVPGWAGPRPGGGETGATEGLDRLVVQAAKTLRKHVRQPVEIRFNSDRLSGGAYTKNTSSPDTLGISVGINDGHYGDEIGPYAFAVFAGVNQLRDESMETHGNFGSEYAYPRVKSIAAAMA